MLGLVGESGSGKSVTALSILRLIPDPPGRIVAGEILLQGPRSAEAVVGGDPQDPRPATISMIFQEPMTSLNPVFTIGMQVTEVILAHERSVATTRRARRAVEMLTEVGIPDAGDADDAVSAPALGRHAPARDDRHGARAEPVAAHRRRADDGARRDDPGADSRPDARAEGAARAGAAILLITHNLAVVAETCDRVAVMYGGKIQEIAPVDELFRNPLHPYTQGLLGSLPRVDGAKARSA